MRISIPTLWVSLANAAALMCLTACGDTSASKDNPAPPVLSPLENGQVSGTEYDGWSGSEDMRKAQEALLEVVAGRRDPEAAKADLRLYLKWSRFEAVMGADARKRKSAFFTGLEPEVPAGATPR